MSELTLVGKRVWVMAKGYAPDEGGMQSYAQGVAEAYAAAGADVTVFGQSSAGPRRGGVGPLRLVDVGPGKSVRVPVRLLRAMRRHLRDAGPPDFVHGTTWRTSLLPLLFGLPFVTTFHGREFMMGRMAARRIMRHVAKRAMLIVTVSPYSAARLQARLGPGSAAPLVLWNGTSIPVPGGVPPRLSAQDGVTTILSLCRLERRKNILACVHACAALHREGHALRYRIAGRGPEHRAIVARVEELGLEDVVEVLGRVDSAHVAQLYREADVFLHPQIAVNDSRDFEGFGITIADAMAHGMAVVAGQAGGPADLIADGDTGLLVDGEDDASVQSALRQLVTDREFRTRLGEHARAHAVTNFRWDRHVAGIIDHLRAKGSASLPCKPCLRLVTY